MRGSGDGDGAAAAAMAISSLFRGLGIKFSVGEREFGFIGEV
jgi:hypothetical protein